MAFFDWLHIRVPIFFNCSTIEPFIPENSIDTATAAILIKRYDFQIEAILFPVSHLLISLPSEGQSLWENQISSTYLNWWLRYFRFWKTNVRLIGNLLTNFDFDHFPEICTLFCIRLYRILSKSKHQLRKYDVISIYQNGGRYGWILLPVSYLLMSLPSEGQSLY